MKLVTAVTLLLGIHLSWGLDRETIVSIDDKDKTQYHEVNFDTRSYNFGYEVGENRQFHHEIRGADGVTYGCFGYFDQDDKLLMTYYVADAHGYRLIEAKKPTKIYPVVTDPKLSNENSIDSKMVHTEWKDLFLPNGCRSIERGIFNDINVNAKRNRAGFDDGTKLPQPGIGMNDGNENDPSRSGGPITGGIGGGFQKPGSSGGFGIGGTHGTNQNNNGNSQTVHQTPPPPSQNPGSSFGIGGGFTKPDGSQGSFQLGLTKPPHNHGGHLGSIHNHTHSHEHGSGQHVIQKPPGSIGGISWTGHNVTLQKPTIDHSGSNGYGGGSGTDGGYGNNGNYGPSGPNYGYEQGQNQGGYRPDPHNPDSNCNNPDHNHFNPNTQQPYRPPNTRPSTFPPYTTTQRPTTTKRPQTYPTRPSSTPNPTGSGYGNLGVQPPSTQRPVTQNPAYIQPGSHPPLFFIPYPFPTAPTCPCYYMHSHGGSGNYSSQFDHINAQFQWQSQYQNSQQPYAIGFIPVLFIPHCMPPNGNPNQIPGQYMQVPYPCAQCNQLNRDALTADDSFSSSDSFQQVLAQAGVNSLDTFLVKSPPRRLRMRMKKQKRIDTNESENNTA